MQSSMNLTRRNRVLLIILLLLVSAIAAFLVSLALQENLTYLFTPTDVKLGTPPGESRFRLGGIVCEGSVQRKNESLELRFAVTDRIHQVPVHFSGVLPDMFKEGTSVIATGKLEKNVFIASEVLAKHDETYMPREVAAAMAKGKAMKTHNCGSY